MYKMFPEKNNNSEFSLLFKVEYKMFTAKFLSLVTTLKHKEIIWITINSAKSNY